MDAAKEKIVLTGEMETLLITLYAKAQDNRLTNPILGDRMAEDVLGRIDYDFARFTVDVSVVVTSRAKQLDTWTREFLAKHSDATVLHLGCGLDSRVFRVDPPASVRWYDVDQPEVIELRQRLFPARDGCRLIGCSVTDPGWIEDLPADSPAMVIAEGLLCYLADDDVHRLLARLTSHFHSGEMVFDAFSRLGIRLTRNHPSLQMTGATLRWGLSNPRRLERRVPHLTFATAWYPVASPDLATIANSRYRMACRVMNVVPTLRNLTRLLRYQFSRANTR
ncbi:MAG: class I SAM-dependent methyltransferase [Pseudonocardiales bacterium]